MNSFDNLLPQIPLAEASAFLIKLKTAAPIQPPDETGQLEGMFTVPVEQVLPMMADIVQNEFKTMIAYKVYAESLRGPEREGIEEEFEEHALNELEHAEFLLRRMAVLNGGPVQIPDIPPPEPFSDPIQIIQTMIRIEQEGILRWRNLLNVLGDNPMKYEVEAFLVREQHHLDELWQMMPTQTGAPDPAMAAAPAAPQAAPKMAMVEKLQRFRDISVQQRSSGGEPPGETPAVEKTGSSHTPRFRKRASGSLFDEPGKASAILDTFWKEAGVRTPLWKKLASTGLSTRPDTTPNEEEPTKDSKAAASAPSHDSTKGSSEKKTPDGDETWDALTKAALSESAQKGKDRAKTNLTAKAEQMKGSRGELYGDLVGRLMGAGGGWKAGKALAGKSGLAHVAAAMGGQSLGGRIGKQVGREVDAKRNKTASSLDRIKLALEDEMNMAASEQQAEQAQFQNEARFYAEKAQQNAMARQQLEQQLAEVSQKHEEAQAQVQQLQQATQAQMQMSNDAVTKALLQAVNANSESMKQRQLTADTVQGTDALKQNIRQLLDGGGASNGDPAGPGNPPPSGGPGNQPGMQAGPGNAAPEGDESTYTPTQSPDSGSNMQPKSTASLAADGRAPKTAAKGITELHERAKNESVLKAMGREALITGGLSALAGGVIGAAYGTPVPSALLSAGLGGLYGAGKGAIDHIHYKNPMYEGWPADPEVKHSTQKLALHPAAGALLQMAKEKAPYMAAGGLLTGGATGLAASQGTEKLKAKKEKLESEQGGGFAHAMNLAQTKARLAIREATSQNPLAAGLVGAVPGMMAGASMGPVLHSALKGLPADLAVLRK